MWFDLRLVMLNTASTPKLQEERWPAVALSATRQPAWRRFRQHVGRGAGKFSRSFQRVLLIYFQDSLQPTARAEEDAALSWPCRISMKAEVVSEATG